MSGNWTNLFGPSPIVPSNPSYEALTLTANTTLVWPQETTGGAPYVAQQIDVIASSVGLSLAMPPANTGSTGAISLITNVGADSFSVTDNLGNQIAVIASTQTWLITLTSNLTQAGTWRGYQLASTSSSAVAAQLAGPGLQAFGTELQTDILPLLISTNTLISTADRALAVTWIGGNGILQLDEASTLTPGWWCAIRNQGTGTVTLETSGDLLNGSSLGISIAPGQSGFVVAGIGNFYTFGALFTVVPITSGGTGASSAPNALVNLGGSTIGIEIFGAPTAAAIISLLGLTQVTITEASVSSNQVLTAQSTNTAFVCTAAISLTLPLTTTLTRGFSFLASGAGGAVTVVIQASDAINGGSAGAGITIPSGGSAYFFTDANGNWYTLFGPNLSAGSLTLSGNATVGGTLGVTGASTLTGAVAVGSTLAVTGAISPSSTAGIVGTVTNDSANAGSVGEYHAATGSAATPTTNTAYNLSSLSLTAGDWDVWGSADYSCDGSTTCTAQELGISTSSATLPGLGNLTSLNSSIPNSGANFIPTPMVRIPLAATTTIYLVALATFSGGVLTSTGTINARRRR